MQFTNCTTREPLFHNLYGSYGSYCKGLNCCLTNDMQVTIVPRPVRPVNHCFTTCMGRMSRAKPFTSRIYSTVLDKDGAVLRWSFYQFIVSYCTCDIVQIKTHFHPVCTCRCQASWDYVLKTCDDKMAPQILDIMGKICSSTQKQMSNTARRIVKGLERSVFFQSVLPSFIHSATKENSNR